MFEDYPLQVVVENLKKFKSDHKPAASNEVLCTSIGISMPTLDNLLRGDRTPRKQTYDQVVSFLEKKGYLSPGMMPAEKIASTEEIKKDIIDSMIEVMQKIGMGEASMTYILKEKWRVQIRVISNE
jgi:hypothetical protein